MIVLAAAGCKSLLYGMAHPLFGRGVNSQRNQPQLVLRERRPRRTRPASNVRDPWDAPLVDGATNSVLRPRRLWLHTPLGSIETHVGR